MAPTIIAMIAFGFWGRSRSTTQSDFLVAGRRLGPALYSGTMAAIVLGGASTIGGVGLGYEYGISGMWLVVAIGAGILALSLAAAAWGVRLGYGWPGPDSSPVTLKALSTSTVTRWPLLAIRWAS